ncbi:hypothetical protein PROFUN_00704 [Planoprotostelium fungivorum]|uniref:Uncharacterized protein n=1 Tax=Planoprotostelium fungivorum TaxID=1890364 RepID=A0A2P6NU49_9EUKA|nr:hypothetical protein PROFUN_00704 [Planoprotostelium fungivorum]
MRRRKGEEWFSHQKGKEALGTSEQNPEILFALVNVANPQSRLGEFRPHTHHFYRLHQQQPQLLLYGPPRSTLSSHSNVRDLIVLIRSPYSLHTFMLFANNNTHLRFKDRLKHKPQSAC